MSGSCIIMQNIGVSIICGLCGHQTWSHVSCKRGFVMQRNLVLQDVHVGAAFSMILTVKHCKSATVKFAKLVLFFRVKPIGRS